MAHRKNPAAVALGRKGGRNSRVNLTPFQREALAKKAAANRWKQPIRAFNPPAAPGVIWLWAKDGTLNEILPTANAEVTVAYIQSRTSGPRQYAAFAFFEELTFAAAEKWSGGAIEFLKPADQRRVFEQAPET